MASDQTEGTDMPKALRLRLSFYYAAMFAMVGVQLPFWPVWLKAQGLDASEIGLVLSAVLWVKVVASPLLAQAADRRQQRRLFMVTLASLALVGYALLPLGSGFWWLVALSVVAGVAFSAVMPLGEAITLSTVYALGLDYGRIRLWGSLTFILASVAVGRLLVGRDVDLVLWAMLCFLGLTCIACLAMPSPRTVGTGRASGAIRQLLINRTILLLVASSSLIQASHAVLYGFGTLHWRSAGIDDDVIGWLWAEGVIAEILLFAVSNRVVRRLGIRNLLLLAAVAGVVRWTLTALSTELALLLIVQALHGLTFGATHLATMHFIARAVPPEMTATAQSLNAAIAGGIATALALALAGVLFEAYGGMAFLAMAILAALAVVTTFALGRCWRDGPI